MAKDTKMPDIEAEAAPEVVETAPEAVEPTESAAESAPEASEVEVPVDIAAGAAPEPPEASAPEAAEEAAPEAAPEADLSDFQRAAVTERLQMLWTEFGFASRQAAYVPEGALGAAVRLALA